MKIFRMRTKKDVLDAIREHVQNAAPFCLTFVPHRDKLTPDERKELEDDLRYRFHNWADTWVLPYLDVIEKSWCKKRTKKGD